VVRAERGRGCEQSEAGAARVGQCVIRSEVSLFELVFVIAPTAGRNLAVSWSCTANGEGGTSGSLGKHELESPQLLPDMWVQPFETYPDFIEIIIGSLDEVPSSIGVPERENWTKRREHWLSPIASAEQASEDARDADIVPS
jgi:hypothetical protein